MADQSLQVDEWIWGKEIIVWGYSPNHKYTFKILEPKKGRDGFLSLQYHNLKSESWLVINGIAWCLAVVDNQVCTRVMRKGEIQNLPTGVIHRLAALSDDCQVAEPSTPDSHAADKNVDKDVVRLHCVHGRECEKISENQKEILDLCVQYTEEAISLIEGGELPPEYNPEILLKLGSKSILK